MSKRKTRSQSVSNDTEVKEPKTKSAKTKKEPKEKKEKKPTFKLDDTVITKIKEEKEKLDTKSPNELKDMLKKNDQTMSNLNKKELIEKVADGIVQGKIPRCPRCFAGRLRYNPKNGKYTCPGHTNDEGKYRACKYDPTVDGEVKREPWIV